MGFIEDKDPFLASLAAVELCGPCRFGGWNQDGTPIAIQHPAPWVQIAAVNLVQTRNTMLLFPSLFSEAAIKEYKIDIGKEIIYARGTAQIQAVTSSPKALEGNRATLIVANEPHLWLANNSGLEMAQVIKRNLAKARDGAGRVMEITNAHLPGEESAAEETYEAWRAGKLTGVYYDSVEAPPIADITDHEAVRAGLIVARGDSTWLDVDRLMEEIADPTTPEWLSRRYYLNQVVAAGAERWIPAEFWKKCTDEREIPDHADVTLGFDGSFNFDATALVVVQIGDVPHLDVVKLWERKDTDPPDWEVPIEEVEDEIRRACKKWRVKSIACDSYRWARSLQILEKERLPIEDYPQAQPMDEAVLTPTGWVEIGALCVGDYIIGQDGLPKRVEGTYDLGVKPIFDVTLSDGTSTRCTEDHLWLTFTPQQRYKKQPGVVRPLAEIIQRGLRCRNGSMCFVPLVEAVAAPMAELPLDPYLLGVLLGDGSLLTGTPRFTSNDSEIVGRVANALPDGVRVTTQGSDVHFALSGAPGAARNPVATKVKELGLYGLRSPEKFVPREYLEGSVEQRLEMLRGLMDTDGTASRNGHASFSTTAPGLRDAVQYLTRSLGGIARVNDVPMSGKMRRPAWRVSVSMPPSLNPFALTRKASLWHGVCLARAITSVVPRGEAEVRCIAVEGALYVTKDFIVTHNTAMRMIPATTRFHEAVMNGQMTHSGNSDLARHVENAVLKVDSRGGRLSKDSKHSPRRIDLAVAAVMAFDRAASHKRRNPRVINLADALSNSLVAG